MRGARFYSINKKKILTLSFFSVHNLLSCTQVSEWLSHDFGQFFLNVIGYTALVLHYTDQPKFECQSKSNRQGTEFTIQCCVDKDCAIFCVSIQ